MLRAGADTAIQSSRTHARVAPACSPAGCADTRAHLYLPALTRIPQALLGPAGPTDLREPKRRLRVLLGCGLWSPPLPVLGPGEVDGIPKKQLRHWLKLLCGDRSSSGQACGYGLGGGHAWRGVPVSVPDLCRHCAARPRPFLRSYQSPGHDHSPSTQPRPHPLTVHHAPCALLRPPVRPAGVQ